MKKVFVLGIFIIFLFILISCKKPELRKYETRAVWMSRFEYAQDKTPEESQQYIKDTFQKFHNAGLNLVIFQVRGNGDAFYKSKYEPWSDLLSDRIGTDPGWDPLQFAIDEAHQYGMELHAWVNTFPAWKAENPLPPESEPLHPILAHPEWVVCDSSGQLMHPEAGYITFSPGIREVQEHVQNVVMDIVDNYDVDGIHFDYIRYPEGSVNMGYSHDSVSVVRFQSEESNPQKLGWEPWEREQVNLFVETVYNKITEAKPWVKVSAAVIGHHHDGVWNGYHSVFQDARRWMATGKIDFIFTMTYTQINHPTAPYTTAINQWKSMQYLNRAIFPGIATYKVGRQYKIGEIWKQVELVRNEGFKGMVFFSANSLLKLLDQLEEKYYPAMALCRPAEWKAGVSLVKPQEAQFELAGENIRISWRQQNDVNQYVLYRSENIEDPKNIIAILPGTKASFELKNSGSGLTFFITAINRVGLESKPVRVTQQKIAVGICDFRVPASSSLTNDKILP
jgi:uncharacterized lipoprotein YddW (UPF0748 family)